MRDIAPFILPGTGRGTGVAGGGGLPREVRPEVAIARGLRRELSLPETMLWQKLRGGKAGAKFRRQHPVGPYVVDFFCRAARLIIEIDGAAHDYADRPERDELRLRFLHEQGYRVLRIAADRVIADVDGVADAIAALVATPLHQPAAGPPPRAGEDSGPCHTRSPSPSMLGEDLEGLPARAGEDLNVLERTE